jgi:hypothetical protein
MPAGNACTRPKAVPTEPGNFSVSMTPRS